MGVNNVTAQLGLTTYLHCKVNNLNGKTVSFNYIMELNSEYIFKKMGLSSRPTLAGFFSEHCSGHKKIFPIGIGKGIGMEVG